MNTWIPIPSCFRDEQISQNKHDSDYNSNDDEYPSPSKRLNYCSRYQRNKIFAADEEHSIYPETESAFMKEEDLVSIGLKGGILQQ